MGKTALWTSAILLLAHSAMAS